MKIKCCIQLISVLAILLSSTTALTQPIFFGDTRETTLGLEIRKPDFENSSVSGTSFYLNVDARVSDRMKLLFELPFTFYDREGDPPFIEDYSESSLGNLFIGLRSMPVSAATYFEGGLRLPTSPDDEWASLFAARLTDYPRLDAFLADYLILKGALGFRSRNNNGLVGKFKIGPSIFVGTSDNDNEMALNFNGHLIYVSEVVNFGGGFSGISLVTEDDNTEMLFDLSLSFNTDRARPGFEFHFPITDDLNDLMEIVIGFGVEIPIK